MVGVGDTIGGVQNRQSHCGQPEPHGTGASAEDRGDTPHDPHEPERGKKRQPYTEPKGGAEIEYTGKETVIPMGQEHRGNNTQWKQEENNRQSRPVLERGEAKEMQDGRVDKVMAEEKNRKSEEKEEGN
jgi:hypothetical protein